MRTDIDDLLRSDTTTLEDKRALARAQQFVAQREFTTRAGSRLVAEVLLAAGAAAVVVLVVLMLARHAAPPASNSGKPTLPIASAPPTVAASPSASSTVVATPPLALFFTAGTGDSYELSALTYQGERAGTLTIPYSDSGFEIAPDGSKVLDGEQIFGVNGRTIGRIAWTSPNPPVWADDSEHLCGITYDPSPGGQAQLVEFDATGTSRTVATLGPSGSSTSWGVVACSPAADRALVEGGPGPGVVVDLVRLSTGTVLASHAVKDAAAASVASHDGRVIAVNEPSGIAVRDASTWALEARIVRWGSQAGYPLIGSAIKASWDGRRLVVDGGGAGGACHPQWLVDWARNTDILTSTSMPPLGCSAVVPLTHGTSFLIWTDSASGAIYLVDDNGTVRKVGGA